MDKILQCVIHATFCRDIYKLERVVIVVIATALLFFLLRAFLVKNSARAMRSKANKSEFHGGEEKGGLI